jgi:nucleotide-binding universal stress UspA family protein
MKTLMATDGSMQATLALQAACRFLRRSEQRLSVLCVAPEFPLPSFRTKEATAKASRIKEKYEQRLGLETDAIVRAAIDMLRGEQIEACALSEVGAPADVIVRLAESHDLTVIGAKGHAEQTRLGLGPVASRVLELSQRPVLIGRELSADKGLRILVGVDGSDASHRALDTTTAFFELSGSEITLIHIMETPWIHLGLEDEWLSYPEDNSDEGDPALQLESEMRHEAERLILEARKRLSRYDVSVETIIGEGNPGTEIVGEAEKDDYDLIVIGATGLSDVKHNVLGKVSTKVAWAAPCSVLVVKDIM